MSGAAQAQHWLWRIHADPQTIGPRQLALLWEPVPFLNDRQAIVDGYVDSYLAYDQPEFVGQWPHQLSRWHEHAIHACAVPPLAAPPLATRCALKALPIRTGAGRARPAPLARPPHSPDGCPLRLVGHLTGVRCAPVRFATCRVLLWPRRMWPFRRQAGTPKLS